MSLPLSPSPRPHSQQVKRLEASDRERREMAAAENAESLVKALEEMERQQSGVLSAALQRSDAALGEVARVKEVLALLALCCCCCVQSTVGRV